MDKPSQELQVAISAAQAGAKAALSYYNKENLSLNTTQKGDRSVLTDADLASEKSIKNHILSVFPDAEFIAEESENTTKNFRSVWIIDPIDGTKEFSKGLDLWGILVAYARSEEVIVGVCFLPALNILLYAEKNKGAYINNSKTKVSLVKNLSTTFMGFSPIHFFKDRQKDTLLNMGDQTGSTRSFCSSFSCYCVASGRLDLYVSSSHNKIWDIAPFVCIIKEAGGKITDWKGNDISIRNEDAESIVSNGLIHDAVLKIVNEKR